MSMKPEHAKSVARAWNKKWTYKKRTKVATTADAGSALQKLKSFDVVFDPLGLLLCSTFRKKWRPALAMV